MTRIADSCMTELLIVARELIGAITDDEQSEAVRAFLATCRTYGVSVDNDAMSLIIAR